MQAVAKPGTLKVVRSTLSREEARAADIVEAMYAAAQRIKEVSNPRLWNPRAHPALRRVVMEEAITKELGERRLDPWVYDRVYDDATMELVPLIRKAAAKWTLETLEKQALHIGSVKLFATQQPNMLHNAATEVIRNLSETQKRGFTSSELKAITGESGNAEGGNVPERLERVTYMRTVIDLRDMSLKDSRDDSREDSHEDARKKARKDEALAYENLRRLMVHPKGVTLVNMFARSSERGRDFAVEVIEESEGAIISMRGDIAEEESLVWRLPPALCAGVANIGLGPRPGITAFALEWSKWGEQSGIERALDVAGNALLALELVGGPIGALVSEVLDFVLGVIGTAVQFVRDLEQDQEAKASAFLPNGDRLSEGSSFASTALMGATTLIAAVLPVVVSQVGKRAGKRAEQLVVKVEKRGAAAADVPDPRAMSRRGVDDAGVDAADRLAADARRTGDKGTITTGTTIDTEAKTTTVANNGASRSAVSASKADDTIRVANGKGTAADVDAGGSGRGTHDRGTGSGGGPPPPRRPTVGHSKTTKTPGVDNRTASGGITSVSEWPVTADNRRKVEIQGRINLIEGEVPSSLFIDEWPDASLFGYKEMEGYHRCHLFPLQWGDEAAIGFMYAHGTKFNLSHQKKLENLVADLRKLYPAGAELHVKVTALTAQRTEWGGDLLEQIRYELWTPGNRPTTIEFDVLPPPHGDLLEKAAPFVGR